MNISAPSGSLPKKKLFAFGFAAIGVNLMNLVLGVYLCDALLTAGFDANIENWTYLGKNVVNASLWAVIITISKVIDGVIDIPLASFLDNLSTKFGKRRTGILIGFVPMVFAFVMFLVPALKDNLVLSTVWFGFFLILFYCAYTCTMLAYYACYSEITGTEQERNFLANVKSVADVVYFVVGFALMPILVNFMNIRTIVLIFSPLSLLILGALFILKENPDKKTGGEKIERISLIQSLLYTCKNKEFMRWMIVMVPMVFGIQMFLTGQNVYLSGVGQFSGGQIAMINACAFGPVPATIVLYNFVVKKKGFRFGFIYAMLTFTLGMAVCVLPNADIIQGMQARLIAAMCGGLVCSMGIGTFFSVTYFIPSHIAAKEKAEKGRSHPSMYFAIQGLVSAVATAISTGVVWVNVKTHDYTFLLTAVVGVFLLLSCLATVILPKGISHIGKAEAPRGTQ
ncbi:MAG: MFS transporter [Oscillospiraceae bacterium]|jgi:Na+/melibiose symporter-like transporter|nr:MFS transporter [Oscillospiraceae bacterium]